MPVDMRVFPEITYGEPQDANRTVNYSHSRREYRPRVFLKVSAHTCRHTLSPPRIFLP